MAVTISRILVPSDFSECARAALEYTVSLAPYFGATVHVLHVWELPVLFGGIEAFAVSLPGAGAEPLADVMRKRAEDEIRSVVARCAREGAPRVDGEVVMGNPTAAIIDASAGYHLVVMGTHGRGLVSHALLGSVAERVLRKAKCPVLTIRHP